MSGVGRTADPGFEVVVVGAGVIGLSIAAASARAGHSVLILEAADGVGRGITSRNSEVVHAGLYYPSDSLKAELCVSGRHSLYAFCDRRGVGHRRLGKLIVATRLEEIQVIEQLQGRGRANGVEGLELIEAREITRLEPSVVAKAALHSPETGIVDAHALCLALLAEAEAGGATLVLGASVVSLAGRSYGFEIEVSQRGGSVDRIAAGVVVDAAGLDADHVAELAGLDVDTLGWRQQPCKGDYFRLGPGIGIELGRLIYPVPGSSGLGIHATLDLAGRVRFGPDATYVDERNFEVDAAKAAKFRTAVANYLPGLSQAEFVPDYSGIRPKLAGAGVPFRDFVLEETSARGCPGFIVCLGIESPGLTAALAIGERVASWIST